MEMWFVCWNSRRISANRLIVWCVTPQRISRFTGVKINVYDPVVENLPNHWNKGVKKYSSAIDTLIDSNILIVATEWPELKKFAIDLVDSGDINNLIVIDASGYLKNTLANVAEKYYVVGETILKENI